jgi:hypothetical protein
MIEVKVSGLGYDNLRGMPVVFLKEIDGERVLPIWIGPSEALAIAIGLKKEEFKRPLTHDLINEIIRGLDAFITKIVVNEIRDNTYYARIYLKSKNSITEVDARPSDSIALAIKAQVPIYVEEKVLDKGHTFIISTEDYFKHHFQELKLEDFGKFKL